MKIELFKLYNGDIILGEVDDEYDDSSTTICIKNPRQVIMMPTMAGSMSVALKQICFPFACNRLKEEFCLEKPQVMFALYDELGEIDKELVDGYKAEISGIKIATAAEAASIASASNASSPKEFII